MIDATLTIRIDENGASLSVHGHAGIPELFAVRLRAAIATLVTDPDRLAKLTGCDVKRLSRLLELTPSTTEVVPVPTMAMVEGVN